MSKLTFSFDWSIVNLRRACRAFASRVPHELQAAKMADIWPVENLWGILQQRVKVREPTSKEELRRYIEEEWSKIDDDKAMCRRLIASIPKRLQVSMRFTVFFNKFVIGLSFQSTLL